ncbi:MAG TPA: endonuclease/exonuclease/phosphatase family protein [Nitrospira sp.]|nr:endonuclease/exonuclease/phosphatase family protein [Nitrospira sp.]
MDRVSPEKVASAWCRAPLYLLLTAEMLSACVAPAREPVRETAGTPLPRVTFLTYNTLHGLVPSRLTVKAGESKEAREARLDLQFRQLALIQPDVMLLQEVNPLPEMADRYVAAMKTFGLHYRAVHQVDACGVRLAPGVAVVPGLNNGLAILAKAPLLLRKVEGLKLSGGFGRCDDYMGFQTGELRYALIAEVENPDTGRKLLTVSLHLHSGIERNAFFIQKINEAVEEGRGRRQDFEGLVTAMEQDQQRRLDEIRLLVKEIQKLYAKGAYLGVIVGGDFNFEPDDPEYRELERAGLRDIYTMARPETEVYSLDPPRNVIAGQGIREVPSALRAAMKRLPESQQEKILEGYQKGISQARRVDFLFLMRPPSGETAGCFRQELFGQADEVAIAPASDHYGVLVTYFADASHCAGTVSDAMEDRHVDAAS